MPSLMAVLGLDATTFQAKLAESGKHARQAGTRMGRELSGAVKGALAATAALMVAELGRNAVAAALHIQDMADQFRVSTDTIQRWEIAANDVGLKVEDLGTAFMRLKKAREEAVRTGDLGAFAAFQIPLAALRDASVSTEDILRRMVEVAGGAKVTDAMDVAGMDLMGKSGAKLLAAFQELHTLGPVKLIESEDIAQLDRAEKTINELKRNLRVAGAPAIATVAEAVSVHLDLAKMPVRQPEGLWEKVKKAGRWLRDPYGEDIGSRMGGWFASSMGKAFTPTAPPEPGPAVLRGPVTESMTAAQVTEMKRTQLAIAEKIWQNSLKTMTVEERRAELNKQIADHERASEKAFEEGEWTKGYKEKLEAEGLRGELLGIKDAAAGRQGRGGQADLNALQRIGAYTSGVSATDRAIMDIRNDVHTMTTRPAAASEPGGF